MLNIEKYKDAILNAKQSDITCCVIDLFHNGACPDDCKDCKREAMKWLLSESKEALLDDAEKEYLASLIELFGNKINECIKYRSSTNNLVEYLVLSGTDGIYLRLPKFKTNTMYKGMKCGETYTLQELGL